MPYVARLVVTFPGSAGAGSQTAGLHGFLDDRHGGAVGAQGAALVALPDDLPGDAVGAGARWRVVLCSQIDSLHVQVTRTYTLGSFARGVVVASYRLLTLGGTASGTPRLPLADALAARSKTVSRLQFSFRDGAQPAGSNVIHAHLVDTRTDTPG